MQNLFAEVEKELPLTMERETDCRETWPKRWALLKAKVEKIYNTQQPQDKMPASCSECVEVNQKGHCVYNWKYGSINCRSHFVSVA